MEKHQLQDNSEVQDEPGSSKNAPNSNDINMLEDNCETTKKDQQPHVEAMDEEGEENTTEIKSDTENKENNTLNGNTNDTEMKELDTKKKNVRNYDDYEEVAPRKKIKLDADVCRRLKEFE